MDVRGRVHSVETLGGADGPGLRMVVFLQGCPLRCDYCHNPDTWRAAMGEERAASEIVAGAARYRSYYGRRGGLTLSGGEPLLQPEFTEAILTGCRAKQIHTAVDTSGAVWGPLQKRALATADLLLLDVKAPYVGAEGTGSPALHTEAILEYARDAGLETWLRSVIVTGRNDTNDHLHMVADLARQASVVTRVELSPCHDMALHKWRELGRTPPLDDSACPPPERMDNLRRTLADMLPARCRGA